MALVDPNIALSFKGIQLQDPLEQYSKASAAQLNALQMDKFMRDRDALKQIQTAITAKGGPPDLESAANEMIRSGIPEYMTQGLGTYLNYQQGQNFLNAMRPQQFGGVQAPAPITSYGYDIGSDFY